MATEPYYTHGALDSFAISGRSLTAAGWVVSLQDAPLTSLRLTIGSTPVHSDVVFSPSPDVHAAYPAIAGTGNCRFSLTATLDDGHLLQTQNAEVVSMTPFLSDVAGIPLERIWPMRFDTPSSKESSLVGIGDFTEASFSFLSLFRHLANLQRDEAVLDAGCGLGRMAFGLAHYLDTRGRYAGFDVSSQLVDSARARYHTLRNFTFEHADIFNKMYNPRGRLSASTFKFPFQDREFTFAFLTSVFTHMLAADVKNYLSEIRRVLRPGGRCLATFFIVDDEAESLVSREMSTIPIRHPLADGTLVEDPRVPESAVAFREPHLHKLIEGSGLQVAQIHRGSWCGRTRFLSYQDICLLVPK